MIASVADADAEKNLRVPSGKLRLFLPVINTILMRLDAGKNQQHRDINGRDHRGDGHRKVNNQPLRFAVGLVLLLEKIHFGIYDIGFTIYEWPNNS